MNNAQVALKQTAPKKKKRKSVSLDKKMARSGWLFVAPFVIGLLLIYIPIIFDSIWLTFNSTRAIPGKGLQLTFVGFENYSTALFEDSGFVQTLLSGIQQLIIDIPAIVIFALFVAVLLNQKMVGRAAFRTIFFIPVILSTGLITRIESINNSASQLMAENEGIETGANTTSSTDIISAADISMLFETMKIGTGLVSTITQLVQDIYNIINRSGVQMLVFLAGLQSISPAIYESCSIDGATSWETFWKITFPMIGPMILVNTVYTVIDSFTASSNEVMNYVIKYEGTSQVVSSAMAWIYFLIVFAIIALVAGVLSGFIFYQRRE